MECKPRLLLDRATGKPKISVLLIDWGVRESFHSLHYLQRQTADRADYEVIWLEFYDREPAALHHLAAAGGRSLALDKWIVLGYPKDLIFHKHRLYNIGLLAAAGEVCVICDSDAIFSPTFIENLIRAFEETPDAVVHVDEVRNDDERYPFNYPTIEEIVGPGCINWHGWTTRGLSTEEDRLHRANFGACMAARRRDLLAVGGADEHLDYLGYICGPYEMTFRLANYGRPVRWLDNEYLYHVWHPNQSGINTDYQGPHDGLGIALRALDAHARFRIRPWLRNPWLVQDRRGKDLGPLLGLLARRAEPTWKIGTQPAGPPDYVYWVNRDWVGLNVFSHAGRWYALPESEGEFDPRKARRGAYRDLLEAESRYALVAGRFAAHPDGLLESPSQRAGPLRQLLRGVGAQPLHRLPGRVWRRARQLVSSCWPPRPPWEVPSRFTARAATPADVSA